MHRTSILLSVVILFGLGCDERPSLSCPPGTQGCACDQGDRCDGELICGSGRCVPSGTCAGDLHDGDVCDDGEPCTKSDACVGTDCVGIPYACDDGLSCTTDVCDGLGGCGVEVAAGACAIDGTCTVHGALGSEPCTVCNTTASQTAWSPHDGVSCDDDDPCTHSDVCDGTVCAGVAYLCNDGDYCTIDTCNGDGTCTFTAVTTWCTIDEVCYGGGMSKPGFPCFVCDPEQDASAWIVLEDDSSCDDGDDCTAGDLCTGGECAGVPYECHDSHDCTSDLCNGDGTCRFEIQSGKCLIDGSCYTQGGLSPSSSCSACDSTASKTEWTQLADGEPCNDGFFCTHDDVCDGDGICAGTSYACNDDNECTTDVCDGLGGCNTVPLSSGECDDGDDCTSGDSCDDGECLGQPYTCDDGKDCTTDLCDGDGGCEHSVVADRCLIEATCFDRDDLDPENVCQKCAPSAPEAWSNNDGEGCSDNDACTDDDTCSGGECIGTPLVPDPAEENDSLATAYDLGLTSDDVSFAKAMTFEATLYGEGDVDFYSYHDTDAFGSTLAPRVELTDIPAGSDYRLCAYYLCDGEGSSASVDCDAGNVDTLVSDTLGSLPGCCSDEIGDADEAVELSPNCIGPIDDSGTVYVRVDHTEGAWICTAPYSLVWGDN